MSAYREGPPAAGLPFPRKRLRTWTVLVGLAAAMIALAPVAYFWGSAVGGKFYREGAGGNAIVLMAAFFAAVLIGVLGPFAIRGQSKSMDVLGPVAAGPALMAALMYFDATHRVHGVLAGGSVDSSQAIRILAEAASEADGILILGAGVSASAFAVVVLALLGSAASIDGERAGAPKNAAWVLPLGFGMVCIVAAVTIRGVLHAGTATASLVVVALAGITILSCLAARHGPLVRTWHDEREAKLWMAALLTAAIAAAASVALLDVASALFAEKDGFGAISGESVDASHKARILAEAITQYDGELVFAWVDGFLAFAIVAVSIGRTRRSPFGLPVLGAAVGIVLVATSTVAVRAWAFGSSAGAAQQGARTNGASLDLPVVSALGDPVRTSTSLPTVFVRADGTFALSGALGPYNSELLVAGDRHAKWVVVEEAILAMLATRSVEALVYRAPPPPLRLRFRIAERTSGEMGGPDLGRYGAFVPQVVPTVAAGITSQDRDRGCERVIMNPKPTDQLEAIVTEIAAARGSGFCPGESFHVVLVVDPRTKEIRQRVP